MSPSLSLLRDGKKFLWDGRVYASPDEAVHNLWSTPGE
jgi:hypothetical protein